MGRRKSALSGQLADIDLRLLRVFKTVVEAGGFSAAENELNLANSTITNYIADLEKRLDMHLCHRGRAGFSLTEQGQIVYDSTLELLFAVEHFRSTINRSHNRILGHLHLGFAEHMLDAHNACITQALDAFATIAPDVTIRISTFGSEDVIAALLNQKIDIGITVLTRMYSELQTVDLFEEEMLLYCAEKHPLFHLTDSIRPEQLLDHRFVESPRLLPGREPHTDMLAWNKHAKAHHQEARTALILSGHYLGFLPRHLVEGWNLTHTLRPLFADKYGYRNRFKAIWKDSQNQQITELFIDCLTRSVP